MVADLDALVERTGADELILAGTVYDPATRQDTLARIAKAWGLLNRVRRPARRHRMGHELAHARTSVDEFLDAAGDFLRSRPVENTLLLTIARHRAGQGPARVRAGRPDLRLADRPGTAPSCRRRRTRCCSARCPGRPRAGAGRARSRHARCRASTGPTADAEAFAAGWRR